MSNDQKVIWRAGWQVIAVLVASSVLLYFIFSEGLNHMLSYWNTREEYSHGFLIPIIAIFLVWQKKDRLQKIQFSGSWAGSVIVLLGIGSFLVGELSGVYTLIEYAFIIVVIGLVLSFTGWKGLKVIFIPLIILFFMVPLPNFIYNNLSADLQLISSRIGVAVIRFFDISVYLEGNVIDLGTYKLQVVDACSGLRYLFPLMTLGFIAAYIYKAAFWKRAVIFLSSIPITILMNSFRIGIIGILVEYWGPSMAEGFLHYFEGWVVFMASLGVLILEMWVLGLLGRNKKPLSELFGLELPNPTPKGAVIRFRKVPYALLVSCLVLAVTFVSAQSLSKSEEIAPSRTAFSEFPMEIAGWKGKVGRIEQIYIDELDFSDYIISNYTNTEGEVISFYAAYYESQSKGESIHSPRTCLPGGGWQIKDLSLKNLDGLALTVNRVEIRQGNLAQLVYYWFQGRGRIITNEYMAKWFVFWDALTRNRTDGALVRLTVLVRPGEDLDEVDKRLTAFAIEASDYLADYIPD